MENTTQEKTPVHAGAKCNTYDDVIIRYIPKIIKSRVKDISFSLWRINYELEEARQEHASLGHLWRQIGCCIALSLFRILGRVR